MSVKPFRFHDMTRRRTRRAKAAGRYSIDTAKAPTRWGPGKRIGNRSPLRAAKALGILDATVGEPRQPRAILEAGVLSPRQRRLQQAAYDAGYGTGLTHSRVRAGATIARIDFKMANTGNAGRRKSQRTKLASRLRVLRKKGDKATLTGYKQARGLGRNAGSFKSRHGSWKKGKGGRFVGSK